MRKTSSTKQNGFTLIEAVVATAVFAFVVSSIVGVYLSTIQVDRKTRSLRALTQNARFITEFLTKEIRNGSIDYARYPGGIVPLVNSDLYILNQAGEQERIRPSVYPCGAFATCDLILEKNSGTSNLNTQNIKITNLKFFINPKGDPYAGTTYNEQPRVTMVLELSSTGQTVSDSVKINIETTFSPRTYPARP